MVLLNSDLDVLWSDAASILGLQKEKLGKPSALLGVRPVTQTTVGVGVRFMATFRQRSRVQRVSATGSRSEKWRLRRGSLSCKTPAT